MVHVWEYAPIRPRRASVPIAEWQSVRDMPVIDVALRHLKREGYVLVRSKKHQISGQERYRSANILPFGVQAHADGRRDGVTEAFRSST